MEELILHIAFFDKHKHTAMVPQWHRPDIRHESWTVHCTGLRVRRRQMLNESSYEFVNPGEDFYFYGRPMPMQDEDNVQACPSKEDIAYLVEWNMDMRAMVSYGYVGS